MNICNGDVKKCPYVEKCYRRNPIHFREMSHPHLQKIVESQLDGEIKIPKQLDFECADLELLRDQMKILQMILKKERDSKTLKNETTSFSEASVRKNTEESKISDSAAAGSSAVTEDLKAKIERNRLAALQRRENKLKDMDAKAIEITKAKDDTDSKNNMGRKRMCDDFGECSSDVKKGRNESRSPNAKGTKTEPEQEQSTSQRSSESNENSRDSKSIFDSYVSCNSSRSRAEIRKKAIQIMKRSGYEVSVVEPGNFATKYADSAPYHVFFTRVQRSKGTYDQPYSITFPEILDRSLGEIEASLQINFMVDVGWLCLQYLLAGQNPKMMIVYGDRVDTEKLPPNIELLNITPPTRFGCHHTKVMILRYKNESIRVVVSTANLYSDDWENRTQGLWISPELARLPDSANASEGESPTGFKKDLERYLCTYSKPALTEWVFSVRRADFSAVNVFLIASTPGRWTGSDGSSFGHPKLASVLSKHATLPADAPQWTIIAQSSSIGSLGPNNESWLFKDIVTSMSRETAEGLKSRPNFRFVYPSINNYTESFDCRNASCCLPYSIQTHSKQEWLESYLYQWKASRIARDRAMPHIKSYTRISPDLKRIAWFVLTSANLSKAAWGATAKACNILNYEAGVAFLPKFVTGTTTFPIVEEEASSEVPIFRMPYDVPLTRYAANDKPFVSEYLSS